jgi:hypothetical protein
LRASAATALLWCSTDPQREPSGAPPLISNPDRSAVLISGQGQYKRPLWVAPARTREKRLTTLSYNVPRKPERYSINSKIFHQSPSPSKVSPYAPPNPHNIFRAIHIYRPLSYRVYQNNLGKNFQQKKFREPFRSSEKIIYLSL